METQIKEEAKDASLCFETTSQDGSASMSFVEQYGRYVRGNSPDVDSDCDFFPDETVLRHEYIKLTSGNTSFLPGKKNHLSPGLPGRYISTDQTNRSLSDEDIDVVSNNNNNNDSQPPDSLVHKSQVGGRRDLARLEKLIEDLAKVRRSGPEGNSIFCTQEEVDAIQSRYGAILDYLEEKSSIFERTSNSKDDNEEQVDVGQAIPIKQRETLQLLQEKIQSVQPVRDGLNELRNEVSDLIEQIEIFERTKMENVG